MLKSEILDKLNAIKLYQSGKTLEQIGNLAECDLTTVRDYLKARDIPIRPRGNTRIIYPIGTVINNWKVISEEIQERENGNSTQLCECIRCGNISWINLAVVKSAKSKKCMKCKNSKLLNDDGTMNYNYVIKEYYFNQHIKRNLSRRSKVSTLEFSITPEYILDLFEKQNRKCAISGINLDIRAVKSDDLILSLDRINSDIGYIEGNVQWLHKDINMMKGLLSNDYFKEMCCKVAEQNGWSRCS